LIFMARKTDRDWAKVRRRAATVSTRLMDDFNQKRRSILTEVCREFYPLGVAGLVKTVEDVADECVYDEEHRLLTTQPIAAVRTGACGFKSHLTPNAGGWFKFKAYDGEMGDDVADRLTLAVERAFDRSRAYDALYKLYEVLLVAGFGCLIVSRHERDIVRRVRNRYFLESGSRSRQGKIVRNQCISGCNDFYHALGNILRTVT